MHLMEGDKSPRFSDFLFNAQEFVGQPSAITLTGQLAIAILIIFLATSSYTNLPSLKNCGGSGTMKSSIMSLIDCIKLVLFHMHWPQLALPG